MSSAVPSTKLFSILQSHSPPLTVTPSQQASPRTPELPPHLSPIQLMDVDDSSDEEEGLGMKRVVLKKNPTTVEELGHQLEFQKVQHGEKHPMVAATLYQKGKAHQERGELNEAIACYVDSVNVHKSSGQGDGRFAHVLRRLADLYMAQWDFPSAIAGYSEALSVLRKNFGDEHADVADAECYLGKALAKEGKFSEAIKCFAKAIPIYERVYCRNNHSEGPFVAECMTGIGSAYHQQGRYDEAWQFHSRAMNIIKGTCFETHIVYANIKIGLADVYYSQRQFDVAIHHQREAIQVREANCGTEHFDLASDLTKLGLSYRAVGDFKNALICFSRALGIENIIHGEDHLSVSVLLNLMGLTFAEQGDHPTAIEFFLRMVDLLRKSCGSEQEKIGACLFNIGRSYAKSGDIPKAIEYHNLALAKSNEVVDDRHRHPLLASCAKGLAELYFSQNYLPMAINQYNNLLEVLEKMHGKYHVSTAAVQKTLGDIYLIQVDLPLAIEKYEQAVLIEKRLQQEGASFNIPTMVYQIGKMSQNVGFFDKAARAFQDVIDMVKKNDPAGQGWLYRYPLSRLGTIFHDMGHYKKAAECHLASLNHHKTVKGEKSTEAAIDLYRLGRTYLTQGFVLEATRNLNESLSILKPLEGQDEHQLLVLCYLGEGYLKQGMIPMAIAAIEGAYKLWETMDSSLKLERQVVFIYKAMLERTNGQLEQALASLNDALAWFRKDFGEVNPSVATTYYEMGLTYRAKEDHSEAKRYFQKALDMQKNFYRERHPLRMQTERELDVDENPRKKARK